MHKHSGIRDNHQRGKAADFLIDKVRQRSRLSVVSAYFTIYAYESLIPKQEIQQAIDAVETFLALAK